MPSGAPSLAPIGEACPLCGAPLHPEQAWCLSCGAAARTRLAAAPGWRGPIGAVAIGCHPGSGHHDGDGARGGGHTHDHDAEHAEHPHDDAEHAEHNRDDHHDDGHDHPRPARQQRSLSELVDARPQSHAERSRLRQVNGAPALR